MSAEREIAAEDSIRVVCRFRPLNDSEEKAGSKVIVKFPNSQEENCLSIGVSNRYRIQFNAMAPNMTMQMPLRCLHSMFIVAFHLCSFGFFFHRFDLFWFECFFSDIFFFNLTLLFLHFKHNHFILVGICAFNWVYYPTFKRKCTRNKPIVNH